MKSTKWIVKCFAYLKISTLKVTFKFHML